MEKSTLSLLVATLLFADNPRKQFAPTKNGRKSPTVSSIQFDTVFCDDGL